MEWSADARLAATPEEAWYLNTAFTPGLQLGTVYDDPTTPVMVTGIEKLASIRIPSGRIVVDAPFHDDEIWEYERGEPTRPPRELLQQVRPGTYRVELAWTAGPYEFFGEQFDGVACAATRLVISDDAVAGWEMGLAVGDDIDRLPPGEQFRFFSDANVGCFADASAWTTLAAPFRTFVDGRPVERDTQMLSDGCERLSDDTLGADLVTFTAESGGVVWLGRTATGDVACIAVTSGMPGAKA